jgi:hypothetical protein
MGKADLGGERCSLGIAGTVFVVEVDAALTNPSDVRVLGQQQLGDRSRRTRRFVRVEPHDRTHGWYRLAEISSGNRFCQRNRFSRGRRVGANADEAGDTCTMGSAQCSGNIVGVVVSIAFLEVAV